MITIYNAIQSNIYDNWISDMLIVEDYFESDGRSKTIYDYSIAYSMGIHCIALKILKQFS